MVLLFTSIERDKAFYSHVVKLEGAVTFHDVAQKCVREMLLAIIEEQMTGKTPKHKWLSPEVIASYYAQSMCFATEEWIGQGMTISPREIAEAYNYTYACSLGFQRLQIALQFHGPSALLHPPWERKHSNHPCNDRRNEHGPDT